MKRRIRLTESDLHRIVNRSVKRILKENSDAYGKNIIIQVLHNSPDLRDLERHYPFVKDILNNDEANGKIPKYSTHCIIVPFGNKMYQVYNVSVDGNNDVYIYLVSLREYSDFKNGGFIRWYEIEGEFNKEYDERELSLEKFQALFPSQYNELINRFKQADSHIRIGW